MCRSYTIEYTIERKGKLTVKLRRKVRDLWHETGIAVTRSSPNNKSPDSVVKSEGGRRGNRGNKSPYLTRGGIDRRFSMESRGRILFQAEGDRTRGGKEEGGGIGPGLEEKRTR